MNNSIQGLPPQGSMATQATGHAGKRTGEAGNEASAPAQDAVALTEGARALSQIVEAQSSAGPAFDAAKVERIRQSLADGSYQVQPDRIAQKLQQFDAQLGGSRKA